MTKKSKELALSFLVSAVYVTSASPGEETYQDDRWNQGSEEYACEYTHTNTGKK